MLNHDRKLVALQKMMKNTALPSNDRPRVQRALGWKETAKSEGESTGGGTLVYFGVDCCVPIEDNKLKIFRW